MIGELGIEALLTQMTVAEKVSLCHAGSKFTVAGVPRLGVEEFSMSDGPHGVRRELCRDSWEPLDCDWDFATYLPTGTALAATWSVDCARKFGQVLGEEARFRGKDVILGPGVNLVRTPLCGRNFEYCGEDPVQVGTLAAVSIRSIQERGVAACVKHYALNSQELNRNGVDARCGERALRELYLVAFEKAVKDGGVWTLMGAYNKFRGQHCCQNDYLLNTILKNEWGFDGVVISDWAGVHDTFEAARHGMDIEMGTSEKYDEYYLARPFREAVEAGQIDEAVLDDKARRVLRMLDRVGRLDRTVKTGSFNTPAHQTAAREIAEEAMTLLKNDGAILPLDPKKLKRILVVGDNAEAKHHAGGYSSGIKALYEISPLEGLRKYLGDTVEIEYFHGYPDFASAGVPLPSDALTAAEAGAGAGGWRVEYFDDRSMVAPPVETGTLADADIEFDPAAYATRAIRLTGRFAPRERIAGTLVFEDARQGWVGLDGEGLMPCDTTCRSGAVELVMEPGREYELRVDLRPVAFDGAGPVRCRLRLIPAGAEPAETAAILEAAGRADAVFFFGGQNHLYDTEGSDRRDMALHGGQNALIARLAAATPRLIVGLVGGAPVEMPWCDKVPAIVQMWYAGMETGNAFARLVFGEVNFSGHLPFTFPKALGESPAHALDDYHADVCHYKEGVLIGYRWFEARNIEPLFPFGFGLSYTEFAVYGLEAAPGTDCSCRVRVRVRNTGKRAGKAVVQLYVGDPECSVLRPPKELKRFSKVELQPGERALLEWELGFRDFAFYDPVAREFTAEPGEFVLSVGQSSAAIEDRCSIELG